MIKVKRILLLLIFSFISLSSIQSFSLNPSVLSNPFPSEENLNKFTKVADISSYDRDDLDSLEVSLITIAPGDPIYSWFGHSALMVMQGDNTSIIYDYGVFSFDSENFYKNFLQGKMYYILLTSRENQRLSLPIDEDRTITKVVLNLDNKSKLNIVNFLNYNAQPENNTYLYDFYIDNCATRIRDILNWTTNDDFKTWALKQYTPYTYRTLSTEELDKSLFVNWVLNSFLGRNCDVNISTWEAMFLPKYLEQAFVDYKNVETSKVTYYKSSTSTTFDETPSKSLHLLTYSLIGLLFGFFGVILKKFKQDKKTRIFGIYNSIIIFFLLVISICITFLTFFSHIQPAWFNENIIFLNPIIYGILFAYSLNTLHKKKKSTRRLIKFETVSLIYSAYLFIFIIIKNIFPSVLYQKNYIIILPIFLFFFVQSYILNTKR